MSSTKRKLEEARGSSEKPTRSPLSPILRAPPRETRTRSTGAGSNSYFRDNCISLFQQNIEQLNEEFANVVQANPGIDNFWWVCEYIRQASKLKELYQKVFPGMVLTCGSNEMNSLGYQLENNVSRPKRVRALPVPIVQIASGSCHTVTRDANGHVYAFGSSDEGAMGRSGEDYTGDLRVTGFIPSKHASFLTPIDKEDNCIVKIKCGTLTTLFLTIHGNLYEAGCYRDYKDTKLRVPKPPDDTSVEEKEFPYGVHQTPAHLYQIRGKVVDMACGTYMNAAILEDGTLLTWGVGTMGELGRPVADEFMEVVTGVYDAELLGKQFLRPLPVTIPAQFSKKMVAISVACGSGHLVVVAREAGSIDSTVYASGLNTNGQLGLGDTIDRKVLTPVCIESMIASIVYINDHSLAQFFAFVAAFLH
jgi:regulator of chromosome condensation